MLRPPRQTFLMKELGVSTTTVVDWASFCRELCVLWTEKYSVQIEGENQIIEVDEAKIGKRKYNKGRLMSGQWIFGGFDRGTTIISDCWKAYDCLNHKGYKHLTVNHKMNFVDPNSGAHTQNIERTWRETRANIPRYGIRTYHYIGYIAEFLFRRKFNFNDHLVAFFNIMADVFPINESTGA
ncbi:uncharacterized protein LOC143341192 [Colletes latitarsis]|uniref:uncharacterized protein LOC143341192 n=1 Tax=Colletes latitarsis TaxID=2605962 RepID=UPI004036E90C